MFGSLRQTFTPQKNFSKVGHRVQTVWPRALTTLHPLLRHSIAVTPRQPAINLALNMKHVFNCQCFYFKLNYTVSELSVMTNNHC